MLVAQWIELSIEALGNEGISRLAGCFKHQLQDWVHLAFSFFHFPNIVVNFYACGLMN
jgi:hypothetical protein